jgi:hypothetical protein
MAKSIAGQSSMFEPTTCEDSRSAISSPASAGGPLPSGAPDGLTVDLFGQVLVPADLSPTREKWSGSLTSGTFGRIGFISSASESLQSSLENRLRARLNGSDLCEVTWKRWDTPWGQRRSKPRARVRTTFGIDSGLWPTATGTYRNAQVRGVGAAADHPKRGTTLAGAATWATPAAREPGGTVERFLERKQEAKERGASLGVSVTALSMQIQGASLWSTASARDWKDTPGMAIVGPDGRTRLDQLPRQAQTAALWPTALVAAGTGGQRSRGGDRKGELLLGGMAAETAKSSGISDQTERSGPLNPEFVSWLMGYPIEWIS